MRSELTRFENDLRQAYTSGNDANTLVAQAKQNLVAANARWEKECQIESEATLNLERARAEEALARLSLDEFVAQYTNALPYAIVPNANGVGSGSPSGNNPAGAALGQATAGSGQIVVSDWTHYLSSAFGQGISSSLDANIHYLYPFSITSSSLRTETGTSVCDGAGPIRSVSGTITAVNGNTITINTSNTSGSSQQLNMGTCTKLTASETNYNFTVGDQVIAKGTQNSANSLNCQQAVAIAN